MENRERGPWAVAVGFEPTVGCPTRAFEARSFGRSDTPPRMSVARPRPGVESAFGAEPGQMIAGQDDQRASRPPRSIARNWSSTWPRTADGVTISNSSPSRRLSRPCGVKV